MPHAKGERIFGVETEFGTLVADETLGPPEGIVEVIKDYLFRDLKIGLLDLHSRDEVFEPAESGGFLLNGGRLYIDAVGSHLEYATAECRSLKDLVANDRAGQRLIVRAIKELGLDDVVSVYNNSIDHFGGHTFGCHENYLVSASDDLFNEQLHRLYPFLVTRQIFAGVGRVGGHLLARGNFLPSYEQVAENPVDWIWIGQDQVYGVLPDTSVNFQLSQRADHIIKTVASRVRFNRALINPKWEHYYTHDGFTRLHMLFGESNQNEFAYALKVGTTALVLRLLEAQLVPVDVILRSPLVALRQVSRDESYQWMVELQSGQPISAIELQRVYLEAAKSYAGEDEQTDWVLLHWGRILDDLEADPMQCGDRIDWVAKKLILEDYVRDGNLSWSDDALHSVDLEYHNINPEQSLFHAWQDMGRTQKHVSNLDIIDATTSAPSNTRALGRSQIIKEILQRKSPKNYAIDWSGVAPERARYIDMPDPFETYA
ncbi:MAG: proteasome accessory factor PafA2 family protein [Fimbriimonadaceae bacterium]